MMIKSLFKPSDKMLSQFNKQGVVLKVNTNRIIKALHSYTVD